MTWVTTPLRSAVHVHPFYEDGHVLADCCWCEPSVEEEGVVPIFTHRDALERSVPPNPEDAPQ